MHKFFKNFPVQVRFISLSLFLFMLGWGLGTDTYFSIYVQTIVESPWGVMMIGAILALAKLLFVVPVGELNDRVHSKHLLLLGKILYVVCAFFFFFAGFWHSWECLLVAVIFNGFANAITFTTYRSYYAKHSTQFTRTQVFGLYFSSSAVAQLVGALISAVLVNWLALPFMYFFVAIFALLSLLQDDYLKEKISRRTTRTRKSLYQRESRQYLMEIEDPELVTTSFSHFLSTFFQGIFSLKAWKKVFDLLKASPRGLIVAMGTVLFAYLLNYVGFLFIPLVALNNQLSLSEIALLFAVMKVPYLFTMLTGKIGDRYSKKLVIGIILIFMSIFYFLLGMQEDFWIILVLTFAISLGISFLLPLSSALVVDYTPPQHQGKLVGATDFLGKLGEILGSLGFGTLVAIVGNQLGFMMIGIATFVLGLWISVKRLVKQRRLKHRV